MGDPVPTSSLFHDWFRTTHVPWIPTVPCSYRPRTYTAAVRRQEHDVRVRPTSRTLPPHAACSVDVCPPRKLTSKCSTSKTRTPVTLLSGSQTTSSPVFATSHQKVLRCPLPSLVTPPPSKRCSSVCPSSSLLCSAVRPSFTGTLVRVWTRWSSPKPNRT